MKSGPFLNGCTTRPRAVSAAASPRLTVVLPDDLCVAETRKRGNDWSHHSAAATRGVATSSSRGKKGSARTPATVIRNATPSPPTPSVSSHMLGM